jgi:hypothetical protein
MMRDDCSFCWYWWNWLNFLFIILNNVLNFYVDFSINRLTLMLCCAHATTCMNNKLKLEFVNVFCYLIIDVTLDDTHYKIVISRINILQWILTKLGTYLVLKRIWNPIDFQGQRSRSRSNFYCITSLWTL